MLEKIPRQKKIQRYSIIISIYQIDDTKLYIVVYIGMLDRDVGRGWQLWRGFALPWTQVDELLVEAGQLVDDHPGLGGHSLPHHPLAQRLQDVRYRLTVLLAHNWRSRPRNPTEGGIVERQVGVLRGGGSRKQGAAALSHLRQMIVDRVANFLKVTSPGAAYAQPRCLAGLGREA